MEYIEEQQNNIFWKDGEYGECVGGFHFRTSLKQILDQIEEQGLTPVGIKINDEWDVEVIVARDEAYKKKFENSVGESE
jgi:hypothetical protein